MTIYISGHGGHLCEAWLGETCIHEVGNTIEEAIGRLVRKNPEKFKLKIDIYPCETTAYERSDPVHLEDFSRDDSYNGLKYETTVGKSIPFPPEAITHIVLKDANERL
jgi:hypothetical protein